MVTGRKSFARHGHSVGGGRSESLPAPALRDPSVSCAVGQRNAKCHNGIKPQNPRSEGVFALIETPLAQRISCTPRRNRNPLGGLTIL